MNSGVSSRVAAECRHRRKLIDWLEKGGAVPDRLTAHLSTCQDCWKWAQSIIRVQNGLALLATSTVPTGLIGRANDKALRMLVRQLREGKTADQLRTATTKAQLWPKVQTIVARQGAVVAAAMFILALRSSVTEGIQKVQDLAVPLAKTHVQRHIDDQNTTT